MFDHLSVGVRDLDRARAFYDAFIGPLRHAPAHETPVELAYGPGGMGAQFYLYPVSGPVGWRARELHIAFTADSAVEEDQAWPPLLAQGSGDPCVRCRRPS